ncbi:cytochrome P450, family 71, subfamily A, polypeptide 25 [Hibiscus trionum]|uniref:Cytochrome P450, family 71, subfamily A, polypeptide 25 n=1 Tax=Hibiscus trionum TaxID=183268 RepID=A0A9W7IPI1_HIBTR|nr:cytochrome P450, family 71, subfamily A, polypeptide 25 [Hibiscus trionum]
MDIVTVEAQIVEQTWTNLFLVALLLFFFLNFNKRGKLNLPPSPPRLPIIGNLHQVGTLPHRSFQTLSSKHGPLMFLHIGHTPTLVVSSAEMAQEMVRNHDIAFSNRPITTAVNILLYGCKDFGFAPYGEYWRQARKICVLHLLSLKRVESFHFIREEEVSVLINKIRRGSLDGSPINMSEMLLGTAHNIISRCVIGQKGNGEGGDGTRFGDLTRRFMRQISESNVGDMFPSLGWLDVLTGFVGRLKDTAKEMDEFLEKVIEEHMALKSDMQSDQGKDFVQILLQLPSDGSELTRDNFKAILADMFVAGTESVSTATEWAMAELMRHPNTMKKVQEEVRKVVGKKPKIDAEDMNEMEYLRCVIKETFRLHPPAPLMSPRQTSTGVTLGGYHIPPKTRVLVNVWAIQRDPKLWEMAEVFYPERFENVAFDFKDQKRFEFIPFGIGRRSCPGMGFGLVAVEYIMASLLHWFDWKLPHHVAPEDLDITEAFGLGVSMKFPLYLVPTVYRP